MKLQMSVVRQKIRIERAKCRAWEALRREMATAGKQRGIEEGAG